MLREFIRCVIAEVAVTLSQASSDGLALYVASKGSKRMYVLYDPNALYDAAMNDDVSDAWVRLVKKYIRAMVIAGDKSNRGWHAATISAAAATSGFGPLLYDIVMSEEGGLMPDRRGVSRSAQAVWKYYRNSRGDITAKPLDDINAPKTPDPIDDSWLHKGGEGNPLNYAYFIDTPIDVSALRDNHTAAMKRLFIFNITPKLLETAATSFFQEMYGT